MVTLPVAHYREWRENARELLRHEVPPHSVAWLPAGEPALPFSSHHVPDAPAPDRTAKPPKVPRAFVALAELVGLHRSGKKWGLLYRLLWRLIHEDRHLLARESDPDVRAIRDMANQVRRDEHKMRAFVRFTPIEDEAGTRYVAWYEPDHLIVERAAAFFADRFAGMTWSILTPDLSAHWDGAALSFGAGSPAPAPGGGTDSFADLWRAYYESTFNAARVNPRAMQREMPFRRWRHLPEATLIPQLVKTARGRTVQLPVATGAVGARPFIPATDNLQQLRDASAECRGCPLHEPATQVVFGEGPPDAAIALVGEQPGDAEDRTGRPFVGPAGQVLDRALAAAGILREGVYLTNAVKHFSFEPRGKRRIHQTPRLSEMHACRPWLEAELRAIRPSTVVAMGATAARALLGPQARVTSLRGRVLDGLAWAPRVIVTIHPSAVLRSQEQGAQYFEWLVSDLTLASGT